MVVAVADRPYYRGSGYRSGHTYYVWKPGIGCTETVRKSGDAVTTSYADID